MENKYRYVPTLTDYILNDVGRPGSSLVTVFHLLENAGKVIASHVKSSGLVDILGKTGSKNTFGEEVQKLDEFADTLLTNTLIGSGAVAAVVSEEREKPVYAPKDKTGKYIVYFDPLDGSSVIDINCPIGTIFSIYYAKDGLLQSGKKQVAAGYILYGSSVMFVFSTGKGVNGFTLDPAIGSFLLSHPDIKMPEKGNIYSINEAYEKFHTQETKAYLHYLKEEGKSKSRYVGSLVADGHRTLLKGGIYLYPTDAKQPQGKVRLMIEVNPFAFLTEQAGGESLGAENKDPLKIEPEHIHQRSPFIMGSHGNIVDYKRFCK